MFDSQGLSVQVTGTQNRLLPYHLGRSVFLLHASWMIHRSWNC